MCRFIESLKIKDGLIENIDFHDIRVKETSEFFLKKQISIYNFLDKIDIKKAAQGIYKLRIVYDNELVEYSIDKYEKKIISSLKIVESDRYFYKYKFENRTDFSKLLDSKGSCSDILITVNGYLTDASFSNIALKKNNIWFTPDTFLLNGTKRQLLINQGIIKEETVKIYDISQYEEISLINSMLELGETVIPVKSLM